ncbi:hypothetical protein F6X86_00300 [Enterococcus durans]|uniref:Uncharacterized protein n=1 Tax=Enterococcus durans TaxID=53345 RepID=A0A5N0YZ66_9ENTE|nr:hypothetical protein F6X86_00300 [Enterococcus durans]KAA9188593.1 hypothetical protein F6X90_01585 [Enterococcus durans]KAA9189013.1 hypothetical protein F6X85_01590 [Enterococcus durans]KAA9193155.1 hypothetical protein F6X87_08715 [Enterococcus durans]KAA9194983.1 hypothetical protein F6Y12_01585 [Enterococcus durans]
MNGVYLEDVYLKQATTDYRTKTTFLLYHTVYKITRVFPYFLYLFSYLEDIFANKRTFSRNHPYKIQKISIFYFHFCKKFQFII